MLYTPLNQIAKMIREAGISQKSIAKKLNITETHLSKILNETADPSFSLYCKLCTRVQIYKLIDEKPKNNDSKINKESD